MRRADEVEVVDAPVSGGAEAAAAGTLQVMVGASTVAFRRVEPVLRVIADKVTHLGPAGSGMAAKVVNNLIWTPSVALFAEGFTLAVKAGLDPVAMLEGAARQFRGAGPALGPRSPVRADGFIR